MAEFDIRRALLRALVPSTVEDGFRKMRSNLEITALQSETVSSRQQDIRAFLARELNVLDSFLTGSYMRHTMISPLTEADIDIFIVLDPKYYSPTGQASLLDLVRLALKKTYSTSSISRNGRAVTIRFKDFVVDVVPGFNRKGGGYLIPDPRQQRWISTDPKLHVQLWSRRNEEQAGNFIPLVKVLKAWNKSHSQLLGSFHLETMAYDIFTKTRISDFPSGARFFFDRARVAIDYACTDPAGFGGTVGQLTLGERTGIKSRIETAYSRALSAEDFARSGNVAQAFEKWRLIFGNYFPAYG